MSTQTSKKVGSYYVDQDLSYPSVTKIISSVGDTNGLMRWAIAQGADRLIAEILKNGCVNPDVHTSSWAKEIAIMGYESELGRTSSFGKEVHAGLEAHLFRQEFYALNERVIAALQTIKSTIDKAKMNVLLIESEVFNRSQWYAGRIDICSELTCESVPVFESLLKRNSDDLTLGNYIIDLKTGSFDKQSHGMQLAAYAKSDELITKNIVGALVVHCERENPEKISINAYDKAHLDISYQEFLDCNRAWWAVCAPKWLKEKRKQCGK